MSNAQRIIVGLVAVISLVSVVFVVTNYSNERQVLYTKAPLTQQNAQPE